MDTCNSTVGCVFTNVICDDRNECTTDTCDPAVGCQHVTICEPPSTSIATSSSTSGGAIATSTSGISNTTTTTGYSDKNPNGKMLWQQS